MNKITCDKCQKQIKPQIESKHLTGGIRINYFRCNNCKEKYLIDVTDQITRQKQIELIRLRKYQSELVKASEKFNLEAIENESKDNIDRMDILLKEIKEAKAELKDRIIEVLQ